MNFALNAQFFRSLRRLELSFGHCPVKIWGLFANGRLEYYVLPSDKGRINVDVDVDVDRSIDRPIDRSIDRLID